MSQEAESRQARPQTITYLIIAGLLTLLTGMEVMVSYSRALQPILVPVLLILAAAKFALIVMFYMHLKFDSWLYSYIFLFQLLIAGAVVMSLVLLLMVFRGPP